LNYVRRPVLRNRARSGRTKPASAYRDIVFVGSEWQQLKQIGNAVPPLLAFVLGGVAKAVLNKLTREKASKRRNTIFAEEQPMLPLIAPGE
jgi:site-specific DNA-cytosine methylase